MMNICCTSYLYTTSQFVHYQQPAARVAGHPTVQHGN